MPSTQETIWKDRQSTFWHRGLGVATRLADQRATVYRAVTVSGEVQYIGITKNLEARAATHLRQRGIIIDEIPGLSGLSRSDARAVEQVLIEFHGLGKNGGTLLNKINSISVTNPTYADALRRGTELLKSVGYPGF